MNQKEKATDLLFLIHVKDNQQVEGIHELMITSMVIP